MHSCTLVPYVEFMNCVIHYCVVFLRKIELEAPVDEPPKKKMPAGAVSMFHGASMLGLPGKASLLSAYCVVSCVYVCLCISIYICVCVRVYVCVEVFVVAQIIFQDMLLY